MCGPPTKFEQLSSLLFYWPLVLAGVLNSKSRFNLFFPNHRHDATYGRFVIVYCAIAYLENVLFYRASLVPARVPVKIQ